jgi:hypothetical protein
MKRRSNPIRILWKSLTVFLPLAISSIAQVSGQIPQHRPREHSRRLHLRKRCRNAHHPYRATVGRNLDGPGA